MCVTLKDLRPENFPLWSPKDLAPGSCSSNSHTWHNPQLFLFILQIKSRLCKQWLLIHMQNPSLPISGTSWTLTDLPPATAPQTFQPSPTLGCSFTLQSLLMLGIFGIKSYPNGTLVDFLPQVGNTPGIQR